MAAAYASAMAGRGVEELLAESRAGVRRIEPDELAGELHGGALVVDIRPVEQRSRDGELPGSMVIDRNVLEWRLDPGSPHRIAEASTLAASDPRGAHPEPCRKVIVVCNQGYASSLAAHTLRRLGLRATDLAGGFEALVAQNLVPAGLDGRAKPGTEGSES